MLSESRERGHGSWRDRIGYNVGERLSPSQLFFADFEV